MAIGIAIGVFLGFVSLGVLGVLFYSRRKRKHLAQGSMHTIEVRSGHSREELLSSTTGYTSSRTSYYTESGSSYIPSSVAEAPTESVTITEMRPAVRSYSSMRYNPANFLLQGVGHTIRGDEMRPVQEPTRAVSLEPEPDPTASEDSTTFSRRYQDTSRLLSIHSSIISETLPPYMESEYNQSWNAFVSF